MTDEQKDQMRQLASSVDVLKAQLSPDLLFIVNAVETAERARWSVAAAAMFKADQAHGCGFYNDDGWIAAYKRLAAMAGEKCAYGDLS